MRCPHGVGGMMRAVFISELAHQGVIQYIESIGRQVIKVSKIPDVGEEICTHPDVLMCKMGVSENSVVLKAKKGELSPKYPGDVPYNAVCIDGYLIHRLDATAESILRYAEENGLKKINVNQGYTKCNTAVVNGNSLITSDESIFDAVRQYDDLSILKIRSGHIKLKGFGYGFIGGTCGRIGDEMIFNGDLSVHPDADKIISFITKRGLRVKYFDGFPLEDIGSIIEFRDGI